MHLSMHAWTLVHVIMKLCQVYVVHASAETWQGYFDVNTGVRVGQTDMTQSTPSLISCMVACQERDADGLSCNSATFSSGTGQCALSAGGGDQLVPIFTSDKGDTTIVRTTHSTMDAANVGPTTTSSSTPAISAVTTTARHNDPATTTTTIMTTVSPSSATSPGLTTSHTATTSTTTIAPTTPLLTAITAPTTMQLLPLTSQSPATIPPTSPTAASTTTTITTTAATTSPTTIAPSTSTTPITPSTQTTTNAPELTHFGSTFYVSFLKNGYNNAGVGSLFVTASQMTQFNVTGPGIDYVFDLSPGTAEVVLSDAVKPNDIYTVEKKGLEVTSNSPIALFAVSSQDASSGGTLILPDHLLGTEYIVDSRPICGVNNPEIAVIATSDSTVLRTVTNLEDVTVLLNKREVYRKVFINDENPSGTVIRASEKVAVQAGHQCATSPTQGPPDFQTSLCDHVITTLLPTTRLGTIYIIPGLYPGITFSVGIVASEATTVTTYDSNGNEVSKIDLIALGSTFLTYDQPGVVSLKATNPILVTQYGSSPDYNGDEKGNPSLTMIPAINQFTNLYSFYVKSTYSAGSRVCIIIKQNDNVNDIRMNGDPIYALYEVTFSVYDGTNFVVRFVSVPIDETLTLTHAQNEIFGAILYAKGDETEYVTTLGIHVNA